MITHLIITAHQAEMHSASAKDAEKAEEAV